MTQNQSSAIRVDKCCFHALIHTRHGQLWRFCSSCDIVRSRATVVRARNPQTSVLTAQPSHWSKLSLHHTTHPSKVQLFAQSQVLCALRYSDLRSPVHGIIYFLCPLTVLVPLQLFVVFPSLARIQQNISCICHFLRLDCLQSQLRDRQVRELIRMHLDPLLFSPQCECLLLRPQVPVQGYHRGWEVFCPRSRRV